MGRIKTQLIKRLTKDVVKAGSDRLTTDFKENKLIVADLLPDARKKMRNTIAGYATRLMKKEE